MVQRGPAGSGPDPAAVAGGWEDSPQSASAAVAEWTAGARNRRPAAPGRETAEADPGLWEAYTVQVAQLRDRLRQVPVEDRDTWARVARETSGAFAAWSLRVEDTPGPLAATSDALARYGQLRAHQVRPHPTPPAVSMRDAALLLVQASHGGRGAVAQAVMLRQLVRCVRALHDAHQTAGDLQAARHLEVTARTQLLEIERRLPPVPTAAAQQAQQGRGPAGERPRPPGAAPMPNPLQRARRDAAAADRNDGYGR